MPFDCVPELDLRKASSSLNENAAEIAKTARIARPPETRPVPVWHLILLPGRVDATIAVLAHARELISNERHWCKRAFGRGWLDIPVPARSGFARRFCALGAIMRAGRELGLPIEDACAALVWQVPGPVPEWNDCAPRTHFEVVSAFDSAIAELCEG